MWAAVRQLTGRPNAPVVDGVTAETLTALRSYIDGQAIPRPTATAYSRS